MTEQERLLLEQEIRKYQMSRGSLGNPYQYPPNQLGGSSHMITTRPHQSSQPYQDVYSLVQVQFRDSPEIFAMTVRVSPNIGKNFMESMKDTGFLYLFNETESVMLRADTIVAVKVTKITKDE